MPVIHCPRCEAENRADRRFCRSCGSPLAAACAACGAGNDPDDRFCGTCGAPMGAASGADRDVAPAPLPGPAAPVAERRLVSVLFADLVGFTGLADQRDPEQVRDLLGRYFELARERIERYGGTVEKFIGDAVMAVWGTPVSHEDDAERAVRAGLELVDAVEALGEELGDGPTLRARAAVLTGEAAVTLGAVGQGMVAGDLVNTASRLQAIAEPGQVLVGEGTWQAASSAIAFEAVGEQALKGKASPVPAWRAVRVVAGRRGVGRAEQIEPPFVGRDDELRLLKDLLHATARESRARLISVTGLAGIGKSRLAWELEKYIDGLVELIYWHQGRSPAYGDGVAFWALGEMVRHRATIAETDGPAETRAKLRATLEEYVAEPDERDWMERRLATLLGLEPAPDGEREELFAAWRRLFERISERGTVVLVFEELQWADDGLLDFIESVLEWSRGRPIYVLTLARPELLERRPTWGAGQRSFTSIHLEPLAADAMELLLVGLVPGIPPELIRLVADRAEGVPLYAVELVRMLIDQGRIVERDGRYHLLGDVARSELASLPDSLHALIGARLDGLETIERSLLQRGAVLGHSFTPDALADLGGEPREAVEQTLRQLVRKELLVLDSDPRSPERGQYRFVQSLIREVAYGRLTRRDRAAQHEAAARYFEALDDPELAGVVASHYVQAHEAARDTPQAAPLAARAIEALASASDRAAALHNHAQAFAFLTDAIAIEPDEERRIDLTERAAHAAFAADLSDEAIRLYGGLVDWYRSRARVASQSRAMRRYGTLQLWSEDGPPGAVRYLEAARGELAAVLDEAELAALDADLARALLMAGDFQRAATTIDRALPVAERLDQLRTIAELLASKGWATAELGRCREALAIIRGALPFAERIGFPNAYFRAAMNLSSIASSEDPVEGASVAVTAMEKAERFGYHTWAIYLSANATYDLFQAGDWDAVLRLHRQYDRDELGLAERLNIDQPMIMVSAYRGDGEGAARRLASLAPMADSRHLQERFAYRETAAHVAFAAQRFEDAYREAQAAVVIEAGHGPLRGGLMSARAALWLRDVDRLSASLDQVATIAFAANLTKASELGLSAGLHALAGRLTQSRAAYEEAISRLDAVGGGFEAAMLRLERAVFLDGEEPEADAFRADARASLDRLEAAALLAWLPGSSSPETAPRPTPGREVEVPS